MSPCAAARPAARALCLAIVGQVLLASCARAPDSLPPPVPLSATEADELLFALELQAEGIRRYSGLVRVRGRGPEGSFDARLVVLFERPDSLRVELLGAFGGTRWSAVTADSGITAYFPGDRHYVREADVADVVSRLLGLPLDHRDIMALLSGVGLETTPGAAVTGTRRGAATTLELANGDRLVLDASGEVRRAETRRYRASYDTPWKERGRQFPSELSIENETLRVTIRAEDVDVNVALDPEAFVLEIPPGARRLRPAEIEGEAVFVRTAEPREHER